ncbi:MAG: 3-hydroxybutyryl-CoA dehydrogenase [Anaerolineales bacterium]|nr:3-hydroxybutyryl-CoA dehydrogenase [Anaerolineales bacterium]
MEVKQIFVHGAGAMGSGIAQVAATSGYRVTCMDISNKALDLARQSIAGSTVKLLEKEILTSEQAARVEKINFVLTLETAREAQLVIEAVSENPDLKLNIFRELDLHTRPETILASNTSSISITQIASATGRPEKVIGMHFMNPVPLMRLVEVIRSPQTADQTTRTVVEVCQVLGKEPIEVNDAPGFVSNRILCPMINEAIYALQENVGTDEAIDAVMTLGMNHPLGPLALADLIGLDVVLSILRILQRDLDEHKYRPADLLVEKVNAGQLGRKTGRGFYEY